MSTDLELVERPHNEPEVATVRGANDGSSRKGPSFWLVLIALLLSLFFAVLESYAVSTILPTIVADLHVSQFLWVPSAYGIASAALIPLSGALAEVIGRKPVVLSALFLFALGSALAGAAQSMNMLIGARTLQGAGAGGIFALTQIVLSDLVTLEERGTYNGLVGLTWAIGAGVGPVVGGALSHHTTWRWLFYLNVPAAGLVAILVLLCLRVPTPAGHWRTKLAQIDWVGNVLVIGGTTSCAIGLTWGGLIHPWKSAPVLVSICAGFVGLIAFAVYEWSICAAPMIPRILISNRNSSSGYLQIAMSSLILVTVIYYLPVYYQACKGSSPTGSGIELFGLCWAQGLGAIASGISVRVLKLYRVQLWLAWCIIIVGLGLISSLDENTHRATSIGYQIILGTGIGAVFATAYFPVLAPLPVTVSGPALSLFVFLRSMTPIWGVTIGGAIFQNNLQHRLPDSLDQIIGVGPGVSIAYAVIPQIPQLPEPVRDDVRRAFASSLAIVWRVLIGGAGLGLLSSLPLSNLPLHTEKDGKWTLEGEKPVELGTRVDSKG
ncbi:MFS general substrate transporter [Auriscalpium vulgare]|uniref:MFS general substrate transporter n=1 Tax=Auriscalpium vulgare TaxID=40419 RepID=A0ACB8R894_9AGAM|nr:MFS general substrate transporter [Auriscalpium vulgare]